MILTKVSKLQKIHNHNIYTHNQIVLKACYFKFLRWLSSLDNLYFTSSFNKHFLNK